MKAFKIITHSDSLNAETSYFLRLTANCSLFNKEAKGVYFMFSDKTKIEYPNYKIDIEFIEGYKIDSTYVSSRYQYVVDVKMDNLLLEKVINLDITDVKLNTDSYNYESWRYKRENKLMKKALKCMIKM